MSRSCHYKLIKKFQSIFLRRICVNFSCFRSRALTYRPASPIIHHIMTPPVCISSTCEKLMIFYSILLLIYERDSSSTKFPSMTNFSPAPNWRKRLFSSYNHVDDVVEDGSISVLNWFHGALPFFSFFGVIFITHRKLNCPSPPSTLMMCSAINEIGSGGKRARRWTLTTTTL